jgi:hypothetical protein
MIKAAFLIFLTLGCQSRDKLAPLSREHLYESVDGRTVLSVSKESYYIGPKDHPEVPDFTSVYGERLEFVPMEGGTCLAIGVFKLAHIRGMEATCANVHIRKLPKSGTHKAESYVATCFALKGAGCSQIEGRGRPALSYGYEIDNERGITKIYLSDDTARDASNTLVLKTSVGLLR